MSSGAAVGLPIFIALSSWGETEHASLLVPAVVIGDNRHRQKPIQENDREWVRSCGSRHSVLPDSGCGRDTVLNSRAHHLRASVRPNLLALGRPPSRLVRTNDDAENPCYASGVGTGTGTLSDEAAMVAWVVGICAFVYLETRPQARDWVVRATYVAMVASWTVSSFIGAGREGNILEFESLKLGMRRNHPSDIPIVAGPGIWAQWRGRLRTHEGPSIPLGTRIIKLRTSRGGRPLFLLIISAASLFQLNWFLRSRFEDRYEREWFSDLGY